MVILRNKGKTLCPKSKFYLFTIFNLAINPKQNEIKITGSFTFCKC